MIKSKTVHLYKKIIYITSYTSSVKNLAILNFQKLFLFPLTKKNFFNLKVVIAIVIVTLEYVVMSKTKSNVFQHVAVVMVLLVKTFVFMTVVLTKFNLKHTDAKKKDE